MTDVAVVDYGMSNVRSVALALQRVAPGIDVAITSEAGVVARATRVVFPGQGAMPDCMREMDARGLRGAVLQAAREKPFLGICIGLQMLFETSEEGDTPGLALLSGRVRRFPADRMVDGQGAKLKVPHMGWNEVRQTAPHALWEGIRDGSRFYFVHSYYPDPGVRGLTAGESAYGVPFTCAVARENLFAVQFHPERSEANGLRLLANFLTWEPVARRAPQRAAA